ncbi:sulfate reduction electron transfer complex DsrMKJOP subunit DsrO [Thiothrix lacustris]|uniref:sulfate reduction electron transfer complex DsrMKJOP subunit DsrO n=1 Tax=Thiothrix lacustris TaxID=525917 RepID=UPI0027E5B599|nr:4Fe-4S dicluster domain-containing protein [Thiothrix lacustris]WMP18417.1 4Fe-4S dicluster domain-containing protein [Thiothrix lacustris]
MSQNRVGEYRRNFITALGGAVAVVAVAPTLLLREAHAAGEVAAKPADQAVTNAKRWGMLIDVTKLTDGGAGMVAACKKEHGWGDEAHSSPEQQAHWARVVKVTDKLTHNSFSLPVMCQHCENPPCVDVCPTGASMKRADGIVQVNKHICIGCRYCMMACPYKARSFVHETLQDQKPHSPRGMGTVESCNMCVHRIDNGQLPACVEAAPDAVVFGDLNDPNSAVSQAMKSIGGKQIRADLGLNTGVRYHGI